MQEDFARLIVPETEIDNSAVISQPLPTRPAKTTEDTDDGGMTISSGGAEQGTEAGVSGTQRSGGEPGTGQPSSQPTEDVAHIGVLALLSTNGASEREDRAANIIGEDLSPSQDFDQIFTNLDNLSKEGKIVGSDDSEAATERQTRGARTTSDDNVDQLLSGLGTAESTSLTRSNDLIAFELSPITHAGDGEGEGGAVLVGARDPEDVSKIVNAHKAALQYCYQRELKSNPNLRGKIVIRFTITPEGTVRDANILSSTLDSEYVERCILSRIRRWDDFGSIDKALGDATFRQVYSFGY